MQYNNYSNTNTADPIFPERSIPLSILFSVITCGIYGLYWMYKLNTETCIVAREPENPSSGMVILFSIITCGIYGIYWAYQQGCRFQREARSRGMADADDCPVLFLILQIANFFVGITGIVNMALMQDRLNNIMRFRTGGIHSQYSGYGQYGQQYNQYDENGQPFTYDRADRYTQQAESSGSSSDIGSNGGVYSDAASGSYGSTDTASSNMDNSNDNPASE